MGNAIFYRAVRVVKLLLFLFTCCFIFSKVNAQNAILLTDSTSLISIGKQVDVFEDPEGKLSFEQILSPEYQAKFQRSKQEVPNYGIKQTTVWCRMKIKSLTDKHWMLNVDFPNLDSVTLYQLVNNTFTAEHTGRSFALKNRPVENRSFLFPLELKTGEEKEIYLRLENHICVFPLYIGSMIAVSEKQYFENIFHGIFYGIAVIIAFYALALFIAAREIYYLYFFLQVIFFAMFCMIYYGEAAHWFPRFAIGLADYGTVIISFGIIAVYFFFDAVLKTKREMPWVSKAFMGSAGLIVLGILLYFFWIKSCCSNHKYGEHFFRFFSHRFSLFLSERREDSAIDFCRFLYRFYRNCFLGFYGKKSYSLYAFYKSAFHVGFHVVDDHIFHCT